MSIPATPHHKHRRHSNSSVEAEYKTYEITPSVLFSYKRNRPTSSYITRPITKVSSLPPTTDTTIGPGTYQASNPDFSQICQFSRCERFGTKDVSSSFYFPKKKSVEKKLLIAKRIKKNKTIVQKSVEERKKIAEISVKRKNFRAEVARVVKENIVSDKVHVQAEHTKEKFKKFEYRMRLTEIAGIKKAWIAFAAVIAVTSFARCQILYKTDLRIRSMKALRMFRRTMRFLGKMLRIKVKVRYNRAMQAIRTKMSCYARMWTINKSKIYKKIIDRIVLAGFGSIITVNLVKSWHNKFETIKSILRGAIFYRVSLYRSLLARWVKAEFEISNKTPIQQPASKRRSIISIQTLKERKESEGVLSIPIEVKLYYLRKFIKEQIARYIRKLRMYKTNLKSVHRQNKKNRLMLGNNDMAEYPVPPKKVNIYQHFTLEKIKQIVQYALKDKHQWKNVLYGRAGKFGKEYKRRLSEAFPQHLLDIN